MQILNKAKSVHEKHIHTPLNTVPKSRDIYTRTNEGINTIYSSFIVRE